MRKVGFIGLGIMGKPMVRNLLKAGIAVTVYDINAAAVAEMVEAGAKSAATPKETSKGQDVVITMVPNGKIVEGLLTGDDVILAGVDEGTIIADMSSVTPTQSKHFAELAAKKIVRSLILPSAAVNRVQSRQDWLS